MASTNNEKTPVFSKVKQVDDYFEKHAGLGVSFDIGVRKFTILSRDIRMYYVNGLCDTAYITDILTTLVQINDNERNKSKVFDIIENRLVNQSVSKTDTMEDMVLQVLSGLIAVVADGVPEALIVDVRSYPGRTPMEPDTEKVVRGARDGYVENIILNTAMTRRRIRDERLRFEIMRIGERSKTDISIGYIKDVADPELVDIVRKEIKNIDIDGLPMGDKTVEEYLVKQGYNPYPMVRYTERPDVAAVHLLEGHVIIIVDTSPSVIITPTTIFHHMQHAEEYRQSPAVGTMIRWVRFLGIAASLFLLPFWFLYVVEPSLLPEKLAFIGPNKHTNIPIIIQLFLADFGMEFLRMAAIHTPTPLSSALGLVAAVLIGQIAIDVGLFVPEVILYASVAAIGTFATPSLELGSANKIARLLLLILVALFRLPGFVIGMTLYILLLAGIRSMNTPYLWPFIPFRPKAFSFILLRRPRPISKIRPSIVHPQQKYKEPE